MLIIREANTAIYFVLIKPLSEFTVKPVLSSHSKIDKTKVLKTNGSLMKVKSIVECSKRPNIGFKTDYP